MGAVSFFTNYVHTGLGKEPNGNTPRLTASQQIIKVLSTLAHMPALQIATHGASVAVHTLNGETDKEMRTSAMPNVQLPDRE